MKKKTNSLIKLLLFLKIELSSRKTKNFLIFEERTCKAWKSKISRFLFVVTKLFNYKCKMKSTLTPKGAKFSKLKYCLIIKKSVFFSFSDIFFYTQEDFFSSSKRFCNVHDRIVAFFSFLKWYWYLYFDTFGIISASLFCW